MILKEIRNILIYIDLSECTFILRAINSSGNPVQNKVISAEISTLQKQISNINDIISTLQTGGGNLQITTLFDSADHEKYKNSWSFRCSYWDDRIFSFDETSKKNTTLCNEENG